MMLTLNILMTMMFLFMNHPLSLGLILLIQTILISLMTGFYSLSYWFSYILFLIMIGGMLVLFIYMTSLASNEMFNFSMKMMIMFLMFMFSMMIMMLIMDMMMLNPMFKNNNMMEFLNKNLYYKNNNLLSFNMIYNYPNYQITILLINYLFLTLIAVVKITSIKNGPLRQKF
uniref:NADH-ubiquinone oxidoreductase chain 6 n=1 Tax=Trechoblemus micros TaxID=879058 RepID=A0A343A3H7_9CARA|nr:NADH dehydrogenase subunit 6 [Trechoblemus micros]